MASITTSKTDSTLSRVEITNVVELSVDDNDVLARMRQEIAKSRQLMLNEMRAGEVVSVRVGISNGSALARGLAETQLTASVYRGNVDVRYQYSLWRWERVSDDLMVDAGFNSYLSQVNSSTLNVYKSDLVDKDSKFICRVYSSEGLLVGNARIVLRTSAEADIEGTLDRKLELSDLGSAFDGGIQIGGRILTGELLDQLLALLEGE